EPLGAEGQAHPPLGAELVHEQRMRAPLGTLEEERRAAGSDGAIDDLSHLEVGVDLGGDAHELTLALQERDPLTQVGRRGHLVGAGPASLPPVRRGLHELAEADHGQEHEPDDQHAEDDVRAVAGGVEDHGGIVPAACASVRARWCQSAAAISSPVGAPPSARAAATQASPSPPSPAARSEAQREMSSAIVATASTPPTSAMRTRPCA